MKRTLLITSCSLLLAMQTAPQAPATKPSAPATAATPPSLDEALLAPKTIAPESAEASDTPKAFDAAAFRTAVRRSEAAMAAKDWPAAETALGEALALKPDSKEAAYNLGLAQYMQGKFPAAAKRFEESAAGASSVKDARASADLAARSMYNQGRARYGELLDMLAKAPPPAAGAPGTQPQQPALPPEKLKEAIQLAQNALTHFKDAAIANPADQDSAANAETSLQLLKKLREIERQQQQQQKKDQQKQDSKQNQQQKQDQQQQQDQKQQDQKDQQQDKSDQQKQQQQQSKSDQQQQRQQSSDNQSKQDPSDPSQDQKQDPQQDQKSQQQQQQQQKNQQSKPQDSDQKDQKPEEQKDKDPKNSKQDRPADQKDKQKQQEQQPKPDPSKKDADPSQKQSAEASAAEGKPGEQAQSMQQAKADKLLQMVRDKEKARNAERQQAQGRIRPTPVDRDW